ncbi:hypothetical protein Pfo_022496, partial [Paulownia fortunei]
MFRKKPGELRLYVSHSFTQPLSLSLSLSHCFILLLYFHLLPIHACIFKINSYIKLSAFLVISTFLCFL